MSLHKTQKKTKLLPVPSTAVSPTRGRALHLPGCLGWIVRKLKWFVFIIVLLFVIIPAAIYFSRPQYFTIVLTITDQSEMLISLPKSSQDTMMIKKLGSDDAINNLKNNPNMQITLTSSSIINIVDSVGGVNLGGAHLNGAQITDYLSSSTLKSDHFILVIKSAIQQLNNPWQIYKFSRSLHGSEQIHTKYSSWQVILFLIANFLGHGGHIQFNN